MPLAANTATINLLSESAAHATFSLILHQDTLGDESDVLKVNALALTSRTLLLNTANTVVPQYGFVPGEQITGLTSAAVGYCTNWNSATGKLTVVVASGTFSGTESVQGDRFSNIILLNSITTPAYVLDVESIWYSVSAGAKVALEWANSTPAYSTFVTLAGQGYWGRNALNGHFQSSQSTLVNPNGNIHVSTYGVAAKGGYTVILELRKGAGFAQRPIY